jgi:hypothetical protein
MRPVMLAALLGTSLSMNAAQAQDASQPQPVKHTSTSATDALTENGPERPHALAEARREESRRAAEQGVAGDSAPAAKGAPAPTAPAAIATAPSAPVFPLVQAVPPGPPQKDLTGAEFALIRVGSTEKKVLEVLGPPSSRVVVPDDDGHLRESLQYWVKGSPMGTVRMDNGRVVQIETKRN